MSSGEVLLPFGGDPDDDRDLLTRLHRGEAMTLNWSDAANEPGKTWGPAMSAASRIGQGVTEALTSSGALTTGAGRLLVELEVPIGTTIQDLMPAVGGGFRAMVSGPDSKIAAHARVVGSPPTTPGGLSLVSRLGPLVLVSGLQMVADHATQQRLQNIQNSLTRLEQHELAKIESTLVAAENAIQQGLAALADGAPSQASLVVANSQHAVSETCGLTRDWLRGWQRAAPSSRSRNADNLRADIDRIGPGGLEAWPRKVLIALRALAIDSRLALLGHQLTALQDPNKPLLHLETHVRERLQLNADSITQVAVSARDLSILELTADWWDRAIPWNHRKNDIQLQRMFASVAGSLLSREDGLVIRDGHLAVRALRSSSGELRLLKG